MATKKDGDDKVVQLRPVKRGRRGRPPNKLPAPMPPRTIQDYVNDAAARGVTPLQIMLEALEYWRDKAREAGEERAKDICMIKLVEVAGLAAPYLHQRLKQVEHTGDLGTPLDKLTDQELQQRIVTRLATLFGLSIQLPQPPQPPKPH